MRREGTLLLAALALSGPVLAQNVRVSSEQSVGGVVHVESVSYDPHAKVLYYSEFGTAQLNPLLKDGNGRIAKAGLDGKIIEAKFLPGPGGEPLNKPKGNWVKGNRFWVTDIDVVWVFDLKTKKGKKLALPGATFANDTAVDGNVLWVSDSRADKIYRIEPADFLNSKKEPSVTVAYQARGLLPNGIFPARDGMLLMGGFNTTKKAGNSLLALGVSGQIKELSEPFGNIDGLYEMKDGSLLGTDWRTGSLFHWSESSGMQKLATGFKGPADFAVVPGKGGAMTVVVPDLVLGQIRFVQLRSK